MRDKIICPRCGSEEIAVQDNEISGTEKFECQNCGKLYD